MESVVCGGFGGSGVVQCRCALVRGCAKGEIAALRLTLGNDGVKVEDVPRLLDLGGGSRCRPL